MTLNPMHSRPPPAHPMLSERPRRTRTSHLPAVSRSTLPLPREGTVTTTEVKAVAPFTPDAVTRIELPAAGLIVGNRQIVKQQIIDRLAEGQRTFVLDFAHCDYVDSAGTGVLVSVAKKIRDAGGELALVNVNDDLRVLFELTQLDTLFTIR